MITMINRRQFIKTAAAATAGLGVVGSMKTFARPIGANDDIRVAVIGVRGKGGHHMRHVMGLGKGVRLVAIADPDRGVLDERKADAKKQEVDVDAYTDYRQILDRDDIDGIIIATPNHLHSLITVQGCQAGKHVYVEKPVSHNIWEGRKIVEAAKKYDKIVQAGTQRRSDEGWHEIFAWLEDKPLGEIKYARGLCYKPRGSIGKVNGPQKVASNIDYNLWSGPRPMLPVMRNQFHYDWHWQWAYGNGDIGNQGPHQMDIARWALGQNELPPTVISVGGRFGYEDDGQTANTQIAFYDYKPAPLIFEVRGLPRKKGEGRNMDNYKGVRVGNVLHFEGGFVAEGKAYDNDGNTVHKFGLDGGGKHVQNWLDAIRAGDASVLNCSAEEGHLSAALCHLGNISYRMGEKTKPEKAREALSGDPMATEAFDRFAEHLDANEVDLAKSLPRLGPVLHVDKANERFKGPHAEEANTYVREDYREPFIIRDEV